MLYRNSNPTECFKDYWLYCYDNYIAKKFYHSDGKWMMFFPLNTTLDYYWKMACQAYRLGKLAGVNSMKVSTAKRNPLAIYPKGMGIIIFYCGESEDQETVMNYGRGILKNIYYPENFFYFKSDKDYLIDKNKIYKHLYYINAFNFYNYLHDYVHFEKENIIPNRKSVIGYDQDLLGNDINDLNMNSQKRYSIGSIFRSDSISKSRESLNKSYHDLNESYANDEITSKYYEPTRNLNREDSKSRQSTRSSRNDSKSVLIDRERSKSRSSLTQKQTSAEKVVNKDHLNLIGNIYEFHPQREYSNYKRQNRQNFNQNQTPINFIKRIENENEYRNNYFSNYANYDIVPEMGTFQMNNDFLPRIKKSHENILPKKMNKFFDKAKNKIRYLFK